MQEPHLLLADEPIANLDPRTSKKILDLLRKVNEEKGITVITILHHLESVKDHFDRVVALKEGSICFDGRISELSSNWISEIYGAEDESEIAACLNGTRHEHPLQGIGLLRRQDRPERSEDNGQSS